MELGKVAAEFGGGWVAGMFGRGSFRQGCDG